MLCFEEKLPSLPLARLARIKSRDLLHVLQVDQTRLCLDKYYAVGWSEQLPMQSAHVAQSATGQLQEVPYRPS